MHMRVDFKDMHQWESAPRRTWKDTKAWLLSSFIAWILTPLISLGCGVLTALFISKEATLLTQAIYGAIGAIVGLILFIALVYLIHLVITPYRQRNEARTEVESLSKKPSEESSKYYEDNAKEALGKHWSDLAILSEDVASKMSVPFGIDQGYLSFANAIDKEEDGIRALMYIDHLANLYHHTSAEYIDNSLKADWSLYSYLHIHLKAEDSEWEGKVSRLKDAVINFHGRLCALSKIATSITPYWQLFLWDWNVKAGKESSNIKEKIKPMQQDVTEAYNACCKSVLPIQKKLRDKAKQRTFKGKCPACPDDAP